MSYTVYVSDIASYVATTLEHAMQQAEPFIGLGRPVDIRYREANVPSVVWHFDYDTSDWAKMSERIGAAFQSARDSHGRL